MPTRRARRDACLSRGDADQPGASRRPAGLACVAGPAADFGLPPTPPRHADRRGAGRLDHRPTNPLFARVIVNRLWHHHFGTGLVETPSDFGFNGGRPCHPELLDWLACEFVDAAGA